MRNAIEANPNLTEAEAEALIERCVRVLYYRDARSLNKVSYCGWISHALCYKLTTCEDSFHVLPLS